MRLSPRSSLRLKAGMVFVLLALSVASVLPAQHPDSSLLNVERIYGNTTEFTPERFGPARWLEDGKAYTTLERATVGRGRDIVRYETETGARSILVSAQALTPPGDSAAITIEDYAWSSDGSKLLVFTNSQPVWRENNRGDYWVLNRTTNALRRLGGAEAKASTLLFAKFSPDGGRVGYVRENDIYVEDLTSGAITRLTRDGSRTLINGTFDWVYEEELGLRDGWRWSPDGTRIAFWQLNADQVRDFSLINTSDSLYSRVIPIQYPKAGEANSAARIGVVPAAGGATRWLEFEGDPRENYLARMSWAASNNELMIQRLNRLQNTLDLYLADATTGALRKILTDRDSTWVEVVDDQDVVWLQGGKAFTWVSERDGWNHIYTVSRDGRDVRLLTPGAYDVGGLSAVDEKAGYVYYITSPDTPTQRYLYRSRIDGKGKPERVTPASMTGTNGYQISPDKGWAWHSASSFGVPPTIELVRLPTHQSVRTVIRNEQLKARLDRLRKAKSEFVQVDIGGGVSLNAWVMKPHNFDPARKYPVLFFVYGGPGSQTVVDSWGSRDYLWHTMLTQQGFVVASVDNRGTGWRGAAFKKLTYGKLGVIESEDQAAAAKAFAKWSWVDPDRIGIWGWSYGGFMSLNTIFRTPDVYRAAISVAPVTHWQYYDNIYTERYMGLPKDNKAGYDAGSPLSYVDNLRGDLLVVHGSGDDNVHYQNTEVLVNRLVAANKPFRMMEYPNRNHGIAGGNTRRHLYELMTQFLREKLLEALPAVF